MLFSLPAQAVPYEISNGDSVKVTVTAEVFELAVISIEDCENNPDDDGCYILVESEEEPKHFCEDHPDGYGCKYYKPEAKQNE